MQRLEGLLEFWEENPHEVACRRKLRELRWGKDGFVCPRCKGSQRGGFIRTRETFQGNACRYQCSVTAGTILQDTKLSLRQWFLAMWLVVTTKKGVAGIDLVCKLGVHEETGHYLLQRIHRLLRRGNKRRLAGFVEGDETNVGGKRPGESGRGYSQTKVVIRVENRGGGGRRWLEWPGCPRTASSRR